MTFQVDIVIVAMMALMVLLLVAWAEAVWRRRGRRAMADEHMHTSGIDLVTAVTRARCHPVGRQLSGAQGLEYAQRLPHSPEAGSARGIIKIVAVYRTYPVMVVGETAEGALLERSLHELADVGELLTPRLWQELVEQYHVFQIR